MQMRMSSREQDQSENSYSDVYSMLIRENTNLEPLAKFRSIKALKPIFPDAKTLPEFFNYNLVSPVRVVKLAEGPEAPVKAFYYQMLKLAFEIQVSEVDYVEIVKSVWFNPGFLANQTPSPISGRRYSDLQYKKFLADFIQIITNQTIPNIQLTLMEYPILDQALKYMFHFLVTNSFTFQPHHPNGYTQVAQKIQLLSQMFDVTMVPYQNCYKFDEADIFVYEEHNELLFIAFLNEMAQVSDLSSSVKKKSGSSPRIQSNQDISLFDNSNHGDTVQKGNMVADYNDGYRNSTGFIKTDPEFSKKVDTQHKYRNTYEGPFPERNSKLESPQQAEDAVSYTAIEHELPDSKVPQHSDRNFSGYFGNTLVGLSKPADHQVVESYSPLSSIAEYSQPKKSTNQHRDIFSQNHNINEHRESFNPSTFKFDLNPLHQLRESFSEKKDKLSSQTKQYNDYTSNFKADDKSDLKTGYTSHLKTESDLKTGYTSHLKTENTSHLRTEYQSHNKYEHSNETSEQSSQFFKKKANPENEYMLKPNQSPQQHEDHTKYQIEHPKPSYSVQKAKKQEYQFPTNFQSPSLHRTYTTQSIEQEPDDATHFYRPPTSNRLHNNIKQPSQHIATDAGMKPDDTKGTFYREFTDTRVMEILPSFERDKIKNMKKKFRGIHRKGFMGLY